MPSWSIDVATVDVLESENTKTGVVAVLKSEKEVSFTLQSVT